MTSSDVTLTREQLYDFVWNEPVRTVAARYGLSDRGLAKICVRLHVPLPGRGYWAQKAVGHTPGYAKGHGFVAAAAALAGNQAAASRAIENFRVLQPKLGSVAAFRHSLMPGEQRMFDATPRFWEALQTAGLPAG